ncbi:MAG: hypothetical protein IPF92_07440 [Myxococcales bacterium]|nr:hypothetical protein [Myxococcales bacterium]
MERAGALVLAITLSVTAHVTAAAVLTVRRAQAAVSVEPPAPVGGLKNLVGDSFELPAPTLTPPDDVAPAAPAPAPEPTATSASAAPGTKATPEGDGPSRPASPRGRAAPTAGPTTLQAAAGATGASPESATGSGPPVYGAAGERGAVDLATAFTRGFPQAASADPAWTTAPLGAAGEVDVVLTLDETGKLVDSQVGPGATAPLAAGIRRTLALVGGRAFTSRGKVTRLHLVATVSPDTVHDGLHGDVFAIGGSYAGSEGQAFFALAIGRRVDLRVRPR